MIISIFLKFKNSRNLKLCYTILKYVFAAEKKFAIDELNTDNGSLWYKFKWE